MKEELIIQAFELLEEGKDFTLLSDSEKKMVVNAFGSKEEYTRMLSVSGIAAEDDEEIMAPSMMTESALLNEFHHAHQSGEQAENATKKKWFITFLYSRFTKVAIPALVIVFGAFWFANKQDIIPSAVSFQEKKEVLTKEQQRTESLKDYEKVQEKPKNEVVINNSGYVNEGNIETVVSEEEMVVALEINEDANNLEEIPEEKNDNEVSGQYDFAANGDKHIEIASPLNIDKSKSTDNEHHEEEFKRLEISDTKENNKESSDYFYSDDSHGNAAVEEIALDQLESTASKKQSKKYKVKNNVVELSSSANEDIALFDLLFTTY